jgi:predicted glutamine amidotransferase
MEYNTSHGFWAIALQRLLHSDGFGVIWFLWNGMNDAKDHDSAWLDLPAADGNVCNSNLIAYMTTIVITQKALRLP